VSEPWRPPDWQVTLPALRPVPAGPPLWTRADTAAAALTSLLAALLGGPVGLIWSASTPKLDVRAVANGGSEEAFGRTFGADAHFLLLAVLAGLVCGAVGVALGRRRGPALAVGLAVGGVLGALVAARVGYLAQHGSSLHEIRSLGLTAAAHQLIDFKVRATGVLVVWPLVSLVTLGIGALFHAVEPERDHAEPAGSAATPPPYGVVR
jgi:hypothetical protein